MVLNKGLCKTCKFRTTCSLINGMSYSWYCEEYEEQKTFLSSNQEESLIEIHSEKIQKLPSGLCGSCDFVNHCSLHSPKNTILNCEHYQ